MTATIQQDITQTFVENDNEAKLLDDLKNQMLKAIPDTASLFEPQYRKDFDWRTQRAAPEDEEARDERAHNEEILAKRENKTEIKSPLVAELINALMNSVGPQFKTQKLRQNYEDEQKVLDMVEQAKQLQAMNDFAKNRLEEHMKEHGIDTPEKALEAFKVDGPGSFKELTEQYEATNKAIMDIMQDASAICAKNPSAPVEMLEQIGKSIDTMTENMRQMQETAVKNVMKMVDSVVAQFAQKVGG
ncbi:hypothetical protein [Shewanella aestuarii]|uniref:Uncharacterized protein n=1 Tax=Shewanella aestuarii TaxID=1028752 RepID=A0A6G9QR40_9GAMM|nr:hypothetical protein [Shewanella aestuarii]QIR16507.1 hypothetical protein HBH39_18700 [Shewanella aestuarii]